ncbi:hypothetical protein IFR05_006281 [Cadophora sp. M221]|nr:hypothetical protein IFR05_006281 [Cadophora sp. M221]
MFRTTPTSSTGSTTLVGTSSEESNRSLGLPPFSGHRAARFGLTTAVLLTSARLTPNASSNAGVWEQVLECHLAKLKPRDREFCLKVRVSALLDQAALENLFHPLRQKYDQTLFQRIMGRVGPVLQHILSFGRAVDVAVGQGPMAAGLLWGGIRILLEVSSRTAQIHDKVLEMLETLSVYLPLFEEWTKLFPAYDYSQLAECIKKTLCEFVAFVVEAILYFQRHPFLNTLRIMFSPGLEGRFSKHDQRIQRQTRNLNLQLNTAGLISSQKRYQDTVGRDQDMLKLLQASAIKSIAPPAVVFPFRFLQNCVRNDQFFGRADNVAQLENLFSTHRSSPSNHGMRSVVIHGLGGCGKSSVAKEYMYSHLHDYHVVLWLYADTSSKLDTQYIHLARALGISEVEGHAREAVMQWINHLDVSFLVVFDNADDPSILHHYWPNSVQGSVIITSRNPRTREEGFAQSGVRLKEFDEEQGARFIISLLHGGRPSTKEELKVARDISRHFGGLPLALRQAASFMKNKRCPLDQFTVIYEKNLNEVDGFRIPGYHKTVVDVWTMSLSTLSERSRILLDIAALFDPDSIPVGIFHASDVKHHYGDFLHDPLHVLTAVEGLANQSLVDHYMDSKFLNLHRFFQEATFRQLSENEGRFEDIVQLAIELIHKFFPGDDFSSVRQPKRWPMIETLLSHVQSLYSRCLDKVSEHGAEMLLTCLAKILNYGFESAQYNIGERAFRKAQNLLKKITSPDQHLVSQLYFYQCRLCLEESRSQDALEAIEIAHEHMLLAADKDPSVLETTLYIRILSNLGVANLAVERFSESEKFHKLAISRCSELGMQEQCSMGNLTQNLASCYLWSGNLEKAEETISLALSQTNKNREGAQYTHGNLMLRLKRYDEALALHKEVLQTYLSDLGPEHPTTADSWHKIGRIFTIGGCSSRNAKEAERCFRKALEIMQRPNNIQNSNSEIFVARAKWRLAEVLEEGEEAARLQSEAKECLFLRFGDDPPEFADTGELFDSLVLYWSR